MELLFLGLAFGAIASYFVFLKFSHKTKKNLTEKQSVVLLDKMKKVSKLITVEGETFLTWETMFALTLLGGVPLTNCSRIKSQM